MVDMVNHPEHYNQNGVETIDIIKASMADECYYGFLMGNVVKYLDRYQFKNGQQDLKKAQWYIKEFVRCDGQELEVYVPFVRELYKGNFESAIKHWEEYRNELSKGL